MSMTRTIALGLLLSSACSKEAPPDAAPAPTAAAQGAQATPGAARPDPHAAVRADEETVKPPRMAAAVGTFDATIDGKPTHFVRLPRGQNRAVAIPDKGIARVSIAAAETSEGWPHMRLVLEGLMLDAVDYPLTLPSNAEGAKGVGVIARYQVNENRIYDANPERGGELRVNLLRYEGTTLTGDFEGKLTPTAAGLGGPIPVSGKFSVELGLRGVGPGPAKDGTPVALEPAGHDMAASAVSPTAPAPAEADGAQPPL